MRVHRHRHSQRMFPKRRLHIVFVAAGAISLVMVAGMALNNASCFNRSFGGKKTTVRGSSSSNPQNNNQVPFNKDGAAENAKTLVIVAGHSVTVSSDHLYDADHDERDWYLLDYQRGHGLPQAVVAHMVAGIEQAAHEEESLLVFSGGATRPATGPDTEGASYFRVADAMGLWKGNVRARTTSEDYAKDSFENLLFSICRFHEVTGHYPEDVFMVSYSFKRRRFVDLHAAALQWPKDHFHFISVDPPPSTGFDLETSAEGELTNAARPFETDPYGCHSRVLRDKRAGRNPFHRQDPYPLSCPDMKALLSHCGPELIAESLVPWGRTL